MPIVQSIIRDNVTQQNGSISVTYDFQDHTGKWYTRTKKLAPGTDVLSDLATTATKLNQTLIDNEANTTMFDFLGGKSLQDCIASLNHTTPQLFARATLRKVLSESSVRNVLKCKPMTDYLSANYTAEQIQTFLGLTDAQWTTAQSRVNAANSVAATITLVENNILDLDE